MHAKHADSSERFGLSAAQCRQSALPDRASGARSTSRTGPFACSACIAFLHLRWIPYLCRDVTGLAMRAETISDHNQSLQSPVTVLISKGNGAVKRPKISAPDRYLAEHSPQ